MRSKSFRSTPGHTMVQNAGAQSRFAVWYSQTWEHQVPRSRPLTQIISAWIHPSWKRFTMVAPVLFKNEVMGHVFGVGNKNDSWLKSLPGDKALVISWSSWPINGRWNMVNNGEHGLCVSFCPEWRTFLDLGFLKIVSSMVSKCSQRFCRVSSYIYFPNICPAYPC